MPLSCESSDSPSSGEENMSVEWMRLQTFQNYPTMANGSPNCLAREGFFYTGQGTQAKCFSCGVTHGEWNCLDNIREVHHRISPNCPFLNGRQEGHRNIPTSPDGSYDVGRTDWDSIQPPSLPFESDLGPSQTAKIISECRETQRSSRITDENDTIGQQQKSGSGEATPRVQSHPVEKSAQSEIDKRPKFPEHVSLPSRTATFSHGWPPYLDQTPQQMAEAGFYFTGNQDYTRCYQCDGGLRNWEPGDNPWIEHCRWYPTCLHVEKGKGQRFVNAVLKKQAELLSTQRAENRRKAQYGISSNDPLETLAAITLMEMGYPRDTVRNSILILRRQREPGAEITALEVLDIIWKEEDIERQRQEEEASRPHHPDYAQPQRLPTLMERLNLGGSPAVTQAAVQQSASITTSASSLNSSAARMMTSVTMATCSTTQQQKSGSGETTPKVQSHPVEESAQSEIDESPKFPEHVSLPSRIATFSHGWPPYLDQTPQQIAEAGFFFTGVSYVRTFVTKNHECSEQEEQRYSGTEGGQSDGPGALAQIIAAAIDEDEGYVSFDSEDMENERDSEGSEVEEIEDSDHEGSEKGDQGPNGEEGGMSEVSHFHALSVAPAIDAFNITDSEEMKNKDCREFEEENKMLKEQLTCKICMENPVRIIFLPCGHLICCELCAPAFRKCPVCRKCIQQSVKAFL